MNRSNTPRTIGLSALFTALLSTTALATDLITEEGTLPAVSGVNGKLDFGYLFVDTGTAAGDLQGATAIGSLSIPLGHSFGLQIDAGVGRADASNLNADMETHGIGAHLFARDPDRGLIGLYGHYVNMDFGFNDLDSYVYGVEGEYYQDQYTFQIFAGMNHVDSSARDKTFADLDFTAAYYFNDNMRFDAGVQHQFGETFGRVGFEAMLPQFDNTTSLYAKASFGSDSTDFRAGIRIHLGGEAGKSLKDRHRQDDPPTHLLDFTGLNLEDFEYDRSYEPPSCGEGGCGR